WPDRLIAQYRHFDLSIAGLANALQRFLHAGIHVSVIELVFAVVANKEVHRIMKKTFILRIVEGSPHQHGRAISDIPRDHIYRKLRFLEVPEHGVYGMSEIQLAVHQRSIQVENEQSNTVLRNRSDYTDHCPSSIAGGLDFPPNSVLGSGYQHHLQ